MPEPKPLRNFMGREIARAITDAVEALPTDAEIVQFKAGENMLISCAYIVGDYDGGYISEYTWDGKQWEHIGYL